MIKLKYIVLDIDGTLLNDAGIILEDSLEVLIELQSQGLILILASGRNINSLMKIKQLLHMNTGYLIAGNGQYIYNIEDDTTYSYPSMSKEDTNSILEIGVNNQIELLLFSKDKTYQYLINNQSMLFKGYENDLIIDHLIKEDTLIKQTTINKIAIPALDKAILDKFYHIFKHNLSPNLKIMKLSNTWLEILPHHIDKLYALQKIILDNEESEKNFIIFGDSTNDNLMLEYFTNSYAMNNAIPETLRKAKFITKSNNENGISYILRDISLLK